MEFWRVPANGIGESSQLTNDAKVLRWDGIPSPDGSRIAHYDKDQQLWIYEVGSKVQKQIAKSDEGGFRDVRWSPDGKSIVSGSYGGTLEIRRLNSPSSEAANDGQPER